jgi:hypothetical protein
MSGALRTTIERLRRDVLSAPRRIFDEARARHAALAAYADVASVLRALAEDDEHTYPAREALTRALVAEHHASGSSLWASVLLVAYFPMLSRLRYRLVSDAVPRDELDQVVVTAFLSAVSELPEHERIDRIAMRLRQRTERQVFACLRKERGEGSTLLDDEELAMACHEARSENHPDHSDDELFDLSLLLDRAAKEGVAPAGLDVVAATVLKREQLREYVERVGPSDEAERERTYQRMKRQRSRAMKRLRELLDTSPAPPPSGF